MIKEYLGRVSGVRVPQLVSIEQAVSTFYERSELSSSDIKLLFGISANSTVSKLKNLARTQMAKDNTVVFDGRNVNTQSAYVSWGLDITDLEERLKKLKSLRELTV